MVNQIIDACISFIIKKGVIADTPERREIYAYGLEIQIHYIINAMIILAIGLLFGRVTEVAALLFLFGLIQSNGGGYHADTYTKCLLLMVAGVFLFLFLLPVYHENILFQTISVLGGTASILHLAPVTHKNHPLSPDLSYKMGKKAKFLTCVMAFCWCVLLFLNSFTGVSTLISLVILLAGVSIVAAKIKNAAM